MLPDKVAPKNRCATAICLGWCNKTYVDREGRKYGFCKKCQKKKETIQGKASGLRCYRNTSDGIEAIKS